VLGHVYIIIFFPEVICAMLFLPQVLTAFFSNSWEVWLFKSLQERCYYWKKYKLWMNDVLCMYWETWMWRLVTGNMMCLYISTLLFWIMTTPTLVGYYRCCTRRNCSIRSVYLSKTLVSAYTEHYILNLPYIKVWNFVRILLHWSDGFCFLFKYILQS